MAFGIDDALMTAAAGISLTDTIVKTVKQYRKQKLDYDLELLIEEVRITALRRIDEADLALVQFERMLVEKKIDIKMRLADVIDRTPFWKPFEQHRLSQIQKRFHQFSDSIYCAGDDIAALVRCRDMTGEMGRAVVESAKAKRRLHEELLTASSLQEAIRLLRERLDGHKKVLSQ